MVGIYLVEYGRGRLARATTFMVDILTGIPSIVAALFIYALFITTLPRARRRLAGLARAGDAHDPGHRAHHRGDAQARAQRAARGVLRARRAQVEDDRQGRVPTAFTGIITGVVLGIARVAGETAPLLILVGYAADMNANLFNGFQVRCPS